MTIHDLPNPFFNTNETSIPTPTPISIQSNEKIKINYCNECTCWSIILSIIGIFAIFILDIVYLIMEPPIYIYDICSTSTIWYYIFTMIL